MIVLDTQTWVWWTEDPERLSVSQFAAIVSNEDDVIGISAISCWEIAKLVEYERLELSAELPEWFESALNYPGVTLLPLTPEVAMESASLP
jgi:PIN domain nuclease of toxin-antitoxin system